MKKNAFTAEQLSKIEMVYKKATNEYAARRLEVLYLRAQGQSYKHIAAKTGFSNATIARILQAYHKNGLDTQLLPTLQPQCMKLTPEQICEVEMACKTNTDKNVSRRLEVLHLRAQEKTRAEITNKTGFSDSSISKLLRIYRKSGIDAVMKIQLVPKTQEQSIKFTQEQVAEIKTVTNKRIALRLEVLLLRAQGKSYEEITEKTGFARSTIAQFVQKYREIGLDAIIRKHAASERQGISIEFTQDKVTELKNAYKEANCDRVARRIKVLLLCSEGKSITEIAKETHFSQSTIYRLLHEYQKNGLNNLCINRQTKRKPSYVAYKYNFTAEQKTEIEEAIRRTTNERALKRLEALRLRAERKSLSDISTVTGYHKVTVMRLIRQYQEKGLETLVVNQRR